MAVEEQPDIYERVRAARDFSRGQAEKYLRETEERPTGMDGLSATIPLLVYRSITETLNVVLGEPAGTGLFPTSKD